MFERISGSLLDPDALYAKNIELFHSPEMRGLNLVMGFTGFADAGHVVRQITAELLDNLDSERVAVFDADQLIDYRSRRPPLRFDTDHWESYAAPDLDVVAVTDTADTEYLLLTGPEPDSQWERFAAAVNSLLEIAALPPIQPERAATNGHTEPRPKPKRAAGTDARTTPSS